MRLTEHVEKGWGHELIWATNDKYCGKIMHFKEGAKFSMHFHAHKDESWYVLSGKFEVRYILTQNASISSAILTTGSTWRNEPLEPHQLICIEEGDIIEVSTPDWVKDTYRVMPGDSQT